MAEPHAADAPHDHGDDHTKTYWKVFWTLFVFTIAEYVYASFIPVSFVLLVIGLMAMAITKAALVGAYFMHLKFEGKWVYVMLIPAGILAMILVTALYPDIGMQPGPEPADDDETAVSAPYPGPEALPRRRRSLTIDPFAPPEPGGPRP